MRSVCLKESVSLFELGDTVRETLFGRHGWRTQFEDSVEASNLEDSVRKHSCEDLVRHTVRRSSETLLWQDNGRHAERSK